MAKDTLGGASKNDVLLATIIGIMILVGGLVAVTYAIADKSALEIVGTIDIGEYSTVILMGAGGALVYLGITVRSRVEAPAPV
jgi:hypothetical protein